MCGSVCQKKETHFVFHFIYRASSPASPCRKTNFSVHYFPRTDVFFSLCLSLVSDLQREATAVLTRPMCSDGCDLMQLNKKE